MGILINVLEGGVNIPVGNGLLRRFVYFVGRLIANMRPGVFIDKTCLIHPESRICARGMELVIGPRSTIAIGTSIQGNVRIGADSSIQSNGNIVGYKGGQVLIGDGVRIASNCMIIGGNHRYDPGTPIHRQGIDPKPIIIEDDVWIAGSVNITAGIKIGSGSVVGAGSVVTKDVPPMSIVAGVPARVVKMRGSAFIDNTCS